MRRSRHVPVLVAWAVAASVFLRDLSSGVSWVAPAFGGHEARAPGVACRAIIPRPVGGPPVQRTVPRDFRKHIPVGMQRLPGPYRHVPFQKNVTATLLDAVDEFGRGGLSDRYRDEVKEHLAEMATLRQRGTPMEVTVFWDFESMELIDIYNIDPYQQMNKVLRWVAGVLDAPVTSVEAVEFTRFARTPQEQYTDGNRNWLMTLREMGGIVHRTWPKMDDATDAVILDRMRTFLDKIKDGGPQRILCLLSGDKHYYPMLQAAQSEGVTVVALTDRNEGHYFPGGRNFTVPMSMMPWEQIRHRLHNKQLDLFRPLEEWLPEQGLPDFFPGTVELRPAPEEELDRRRMHDFVAKGRYLPAKAKFLGHYVRNGLRLNYTLAAAMQQALDRTGTMGTRTGRLKPRAYDALQKDLENLRTNSPEHSAAVFWNVETMRMTLQGPTQLEMVGRVVRWCEGFLGMPVQRLEASRYVEPWDRLGASPHDWLYSIKQAGGLIHRVWPPRNEMTNMVLMRSVGALAKAAASGGTTAGTTADGDVRLPRVVCVFAKDLYFDEQMRAAQRAGISAFWFGPKQRGIYYPANSEEQVRLNILDWQTITSELSVSNMNPFLPGAWTPDAPPPRYQKTPIPVDMKWGRPDELQLDSSVLRIPQEVLESAVGVGF